ncbi:MAG: 3-dehydroquinate synthase [Bacteroidota bacterium]
MSTLTLPNYSIYIADINSSLQQWLEGKDYTRTAILVDENTRLDCLPRLEGLPGMADALIIEITSGEQQKNVRTCEHIWQQLMDGGADRRSLMINLGGGVIGDMGGFCASTFKRGMDFLQLPTTLLSQVDASVGSKLGIDFGQVKNSVGLFVDPQGVFIDPAFLRTLPPRELRSGMAEIIKHSLIRDVQQWAQLLAIDQLAEVDWTDFLQPSLEIKQAIVAEDPFEYGVRKALNFGHTLGHAVESMALETAAPLLHGEAIAVGMVGEAYLSHRQLGLPEADLQRIAEFILRHYGHRPIGEEQWPELLRLMRKDKKNEREVINFTLLKAVGEFEINQHSTDEAILEAVRFYNTLA